MGFLHEGHLSLVRKAKEENDIVFVSIFVNPTQFAPNEDLDSYPRDLERDLRLLSELDVDVVFTPGEETMYPPGFQTDISVKQVSKLLEGRARPTHFKGVAVVVAKLINIIDPAKAYFGQKDAQQCVLIKRMVEDLNFDVEIVVCPIVRERDGLAMSSRNARLSANDRAAAPIVYQSLLSAFNSFLEGERNGDKLRKQISETLGSEPAARIDYVSVADPITLEELSIVEKGALMSTAVYFGDIRLIDNILLE
jgi:pantoate--beta-alanine ligase